MAVMFARVELSSRWVIWHWLLVMNSHGQLTFGLENTISFLHSAVKGDHLIAEAKEKFDHKKIPFCQVDIRNQNGELIATISGIAYRKKAPMEFDKLM